MSTTRLHHDIVVALIDLAYSASSAGDTDAIDNLIDAAAVRVLEIVGAASPDPDRCLDCGVLPGLPHIDGCDMARCVVTGEQRIICDSWRKAVEYGRPPNEHDCGRDVWRPGPAPEPVRVVDGLTVGARYCVHQIKGLTVGAAFRNKASGYYIFDPGVPVSGMVEVHENDVASGAAIITDLDRNRVDYWAEQARAFIADARALGIPDPELPETPTRHALPRVLDEQESTR